MKKHSDSEDLSNLSLCGHFWILHDFLDDIERGPYGRHLVHDLRLDVCVRLEPLVGEKAA